MAIRGHSRQLFVYERSAILSRIRNILRIMVFTVRFRTSLLVTSHNKLFYKQLYDKYVT